MKLLAGLDVTAKAIERAAEAIGAEIGRRDQLEIGRAKQLVLPVVSKQNIQKMYVLMDGVQVPVVAAETEGRTGRIEGQRVLAYRGEPGVGPESSIETFAALKVYVDNWRWQDVPFYLRTGKRLPFSSYMLPDAGSIQESEVMTLNRRNAARGRALVTPIYTQRDAIASLDAFRPVDYETWVQIMPGVRARYWNAGHLLGSASIEIEFAGEGASGKPLRVLASGDLGPDAKLLQP